MTTIPIMKDVKPKSSRRNGKSIGFKDFVFAEANITFRADLRLVGRSVTMFEIVFEHPSYVRASATHGDINEAYRQVEQQLLSQISVTWEPYMKVAFNWSMPKLHRNSTPNLQGSYLEEKNADSSGWAYRASELTVTLQTVPMLFGTRANGTLCHRKMRDSAVYDGHPDPENGLAKHNTWGSHPHVMYIEMNDAGKQMLNTLYHQFGVWIMGMVGGMSPKQLEQTGAFAVEQWLLPQASK